jgi:hypothetical protein
VFSGSITAACASSGILATLMSAIVLIAPRRVECSVRPLRYRISCGSPATFFFWSISVERLALFTRHIRIFSRILSSSRRYQARQGCLDNPEMRA